MVVVIGTDEFDAWFQELDGQGRTVDQQENQRAREAMKKWADIKAKKLSPEQTADIRKEAVQELLEMSLREIRALSGKTQAEVAELVEMTQSALSRMENREDTPIPTLRRYVQALGGELEVVAVLGNKRITLAGV